MEQENLVGVTHLSDAPDPEGRPRREEGVYDVSLKDKNSIGKKKGSHLGERGGKESKRKGGKGARDMVKNTDCSSRVPGLDFPYSHDGSQPSATLVPGDLMTSCGLRRHQASRCCS